MTHCELILAALSDGEWHSTASLYRECGPMILHSRISDLRERGKRDGFTIEHRHVGGTGAEAHEYLYLPTDSTTPTLHRMTMTQLEAGVALFTEDGLAEPPPRIVETTAAVVADERGQLSMVEPDGFVFLGGFEEPRLTLEPRPGHVVAVTEIPPCDICGNAPAILDGPTTAGPWAYMCVDCAALYHRHDRRTGVGIGQRLVEAKP